MDLYNTYSRDLERFRPAGPAVTMYVCGITPYDTTHLGHAFTYTVADILVRHLESQGWPVKYAQNVTDVDDDILRKAAEVGEDWRAVGNRWTAHYIEDMQALNVRPPDYFPRASDAIDAILALADKLLTLGLAYVVDGSVYYQVANWPEFGQLSHIPRADMLPIANERGNRADDPKKRDPLDFVLWQAQAPGEPAWDSPWGLGRPGWHIECSALSTSLLGDTIDLHSGGSDLIFPHHECEIAQSEPATGSRPFFALLAAHGHGGARRRQDEQISGEPDHGERPAPALVAGRDPPVPRPPSLPPGLGPRRGRTRIGRTAGSKAARCRERARRRPGDRRGQFSAAPGGGARRRPQYPAALEVLEQLADAILAGGRATRQTRCGA